MISGDENLRLMYIISGALLPGPKEFDSRHRQSLNLDPMNIVIELTTISSTMQNEASLRARKLERSDDKQGLVLSKFQTRLLTFTSKEI